MKGRMVINRLSFPGREKGEEEVRNFNLES